MKFTNIIKSYLKGLEENNYEAIIELFEDDGIVVSPLYGEHLASEFYQKMLQDTNQTEINLLHLFDSESNNISACQFIANWTLKDGSNSQLNVVDIFEFSTNNKIKKLTLIYDTFETRKHFDKIQD